MTGTSHTGAARRAAVACGLGVILAAVLAGPSSAAPSPDPSPGGGDQKTATREGTGGKATAGEKAGGRAAAGDKADAGRAAGGKEAAGEKTGGRAADGKASAAKAAAGNASAGNVPRLSISVDNGRTAAQEGDRLTYTVTVRNIGTAGARNLHLTQSLPPGLKFVSADGHGAVRHGQIVWSADVRAGKDVTFHTTAKVQDTPDQLLRLATVACASTGADAKPIVCATHSDELPAGAAAAEAARLAAHPATGTLRYVLMGIGLLIVAVAGTLVARRTRRQARLRLPS
ncbi:conserved repeat domain-containing protein [Streptosporangium subroseum]|uniref:Conserved repeat domain-containing protein n=1 Tax=Streptosporangium subroseum TaxID=106412 RepID=A0A239J7A3_9ACTN|nr:DUF11 domain-containing protein [Streptosporangium subroseum]SNT01896.1 conserved repeat domain-containing protein [Streptosporangium subroseum]